MFKPHSKCSCSTCAEVAADVAQWYGCVCLINEFMTTWYTDTQSNQAQFTYSHHFSVCRAATQQMLGNYCTIVTVCPLCAWFPHVWLKVKMLELERKTAESEDITRSHLYLSLFLSTLITCFIFLLVSFLQSDILAVIYLSFQISHKSFYLPLSFSAFFFLNFLLPPHCQHLNQLNCQKHILLSPHSLTHSQARTHPSPPSFPFPLWGETSVSTLLHINTMAHNCLSDFWNYILKTRACIIKNFFNFLFRVKFILPED